MKKLLIATFLLSFVLCPLAEARVKYDSTGRYIVESDTIRSRRVKAQETQYAAAAKINYDQEVTQVKKKTNQPRPSYTRHKSN